MATISNKSTRPGSPQWKPKAIAQPDVGLPSPKPQPKDWKPMDGTDINVGFPSKKPGIKIRGTGAATKGLKANGPIA